MVKLSCEACGGADIIKQGEYFVCQFCGVKYTPSDVRTMLGTVRIDNTDRIKNLYQLARRAKDESNGENAARYYDMILLDDPTSWEAAFYHTYFKAIGCKIYEIESACISIKNNIISVLNLIKDYVDTSEEQKKAVLEVAKRCQSFASLMYYSAKNYFEEHPSAVKGDDIQDMLNRCYAATILMYAIGDSINDIFSNNDSLSIIKAPIWKDGIKMHCALIRYAADAGVYRKIIKHYVDKVKAIDPSYKSPNMYGCYVATCVYGSYDCPEVWTLRRYRDFTLAKSWYGRLLIRFYYSVSPTLVKLFGKTRWFRKVITPCLNRIVHKLRSSGFDDTPYEDKLF